MLLGDIQVVLLRRLILLCDMLVTKPQYRRGNNSNFRSEFELHINQNRNNQVYPGGGSQNWNQSIDNSIKFAADKFNKVSFNEPGANGAKCYLSEVTKDKFATDVCSRRMDFYLSCNFKNANAFLECSE